MKIIQTPLVAFTVAVLCLALSAPVVAQTGSENGEWRFYGGGPGSTRYSSLAQIDATNVQELEVVWRWRADNFGPRPESNYRATPIMIDGVLYVTAGLRRAVAAIDSETGETLWVYRLDEGERGSHSPRLNSGRGVAFWESGDESRIIFITPGHQMVALDPNTGVAVPEFGNGGIVDLKLGLGRELDLETAPIGSSSPPLVVADVIVVGAALPSGAVPPSPEMPPGHIRGFDVRTGEQLWVFHTIPEPGEFGNETWEDGSSEYTGNTSSWITFSADTALGYVYLPLEAATGDYYGGHRLGDNLFSQSLVCLDAKTGQRVWHFQTVHHGIWDYDLPTAPILADVTVDGVDIPIVAQVTKQSFTFVFDRRTGEPIWPIEERAVAQSDVPGERTSPTQPFPTKPDPFDVQGISENNLIDFTPELRAEAIRIASRYRMGPIYTPPSVRDTNGTLGTLLLPGVLGGANWPGAALDPQTGVLYVQSVTNPTAIGLVSDTARSKMNFVRGFASLRGPQGLPLVKPPWGRMTAIDLNTGDHLWMVPNGDTPDYVASHPALENVDLPRTGRPDRGGILVTKTLLFAGEGGGMIAGTGAGGKMFRAHDKASGEIVFEFELPGRQTGLPMTYMVNGRQFIVVAVGAPGMPGELVALALPEDMIE